MDALVGNSSVNGGIVQCHVRLPEGSHSRFYWAGLKENNSTAMQTVWFGHPNMERSYIFSLKPMRFCAATGWLIFAGMALLVCLEGFPVRGLYSSSKKYKNHIKTSTKTWNRGHYSHDKFMRSQDLKANKTSGSAVQ